MAEKAEVMNGETKQVDEEIEVVNADFIESDESFEQISPEKSHGDSGKDEVDAKDVVVTEPKRKKSGLLGRLSTRKKKSKSKTKQEDNLDAAKNDSTTEVNDEKEEETVEEKTVEVEENSEKTADETEQQPEQDQEEEIKKEVEVIETPDQTDSAKKKKVSRIRRLSFSKMKKSRKAKKLAEENADAENKAEKDNEEKGNEDSDSGTVQNVQNECELPGATDQSFTELSLNEPISDKIESGDEQDKDNESGQEENGGNASYLYTVAHMPVDMAQKAIQTIKQVFKPVIIYIVRKNPHCFKDIIDGNKKNTRYHTQV